MDADKQWFCKSKISVSETMVQAGSRCDSTGNKSCLLPTTSYIRSSLHLHPSSLLLDVSPLNPSLSPFLNPSLGPRASPEVTPALAYAGEEKKKDEKQGEKVSPGPKEMSKRRFAAPEPQASTDLSDFYGNHNGSRASVTARL